MENSVFLTERSIWNSHAKRHRNGKIKVGIQSKSGIAMKILGVSLILLTIYAFMTFDYKDIDFFDAVSATFHNIKAVFLQPKLSRDSVSSILYQLLITFCLGVLSTVFGAVLALSLIHTDAADEEDSVDLGGRRIIKKKKKKKE